MPRRAIDRPAPSTVARAGRGDSATLTAPLRVRRRAAPSVARLALTACLTVTIQSTSATDYPPPPGPYQSEPGAQPGVSPSFRAGRQSTGAFSAVPEDRARALARGSSGREDAEGRYDAAAWPGSTPRSGATERFRPAAATEYSQPPVLPATPRSPGDRVYTAYPRARRDATSRSPSRAYPTPNRSSGLIDTSAASATGDAPAGSKESALRTDRPRSPGDSGEPARRMPQAPVFRPSGSADR